MMPDPNQSYVRYSSNKDKKKLQDTIHFFIAKFVFIENQNNRAIEAKTNN